MYETQDEPQLKGGMPVYRIAQGKLLRGREEDGTLQEIPQIIGNLVRIGIHHGTTKDGTTYSKLEAELDTTKLGKVSVGTNLSSKMSTLTFAEGLLACKPGERIGITAAQSAKRNRYGSYTTYANLFRVVGSDALPIKNKIGGQGEDLDDNVGRALELIEKHPAYAERPKRVLDEDEEAATATPPAAATLHAAINMGGVWPKTKYHTQYMEACEAAAKVLKISGTYATWDDVPAQVIELLKTWHDQKKMPAALKGLPIDEEYDPFADS